MKKFEPDPQPFTPQVSQPPTQSQQFDLNKLLQILPKLNLGTLFGAKNNEPPAPPPPNTATNYIQHQNRIETMKVISKHTQTIQRIREENGQK
ncbi:MAG: hypothetical protein IJ301_03240 [Clostridia bacterium]|nr:hypothetical protein [Clostridia bacterium]